MTVKVNADQRVFVIDVGGGFSCFGFDNAQRDAAAIADRLNRPELAPTASELGTISGYEKYKAAVAAWCQSPLTSQTWFTPGTSPAVQKILESARDSHRALRLFYGDPTTGRDWMEENDLVGTIGRSTGGQKIPLLIEPGEGGGPAILTDRIVRILDALTAKQLYQCESYQVPQLRVAQVKDAKMRAKGLQFEVLDAGEICHARFRTEFEAHDYVAFLTGEVACSRDQLKALMRRERVMT